MNAELAIELIKGLMLESVLITAPILLTGLVIGLIISLFQTVTSIHEQTLTFYPKTLGIVAMLIFLLPWLTRSLIEFTTRMIERMPSMAG